MEKRAHGMKNAKDCTLGCVKGGAKFVLYDGVKAYDLDDQTKPEAFAGQKVRVTGGGWDAGTNMIHVEDIKRWSRRFLSGNHTPLGAGAGAP